MTNAVRSGASVLLGATLFASASLSAEPDDRSVQLSISVRKPRTVCFKDRVEVTGVLAARSLVEVGADREGQKVAQVLVQPLEEVAAGQILARLVRLDDPGNPAAGGSPVRAPVAGVLVRSSAVVGAPVSARLGPLFAIVTGGEIDLQADVPVADLAKLKAGQAAAVTPLGLPTSPGKVRGIEAAATPATQLGRAQIALEAGRDLRIGTFARAIVSVGERCGLGVPYSAVSFEPEGTIVHVVNGDRVEARPVEVGLLSGEDAEIRTGIGEDDVVAIRAGAFLREGDRVYPIMVKDAAAR